MTSEQTSIVDDARAALVADGAMSVAASAAFSGMSKSYLYGRMEAGELAYLKLGKSRRIPRRALHQLMADALVGGGTAD